jgi:hypothetical protein
LRYPGTHGGVVKGHEHEPTAGRQPDPDRAKRRQVSGSDNVDSLQLADLVDLGVDNVVAPPFPDVRSLEHASLLSAAALLISHVSLPGERPVGPGDLLAPPGDRLPDEAAGLLPGRLAATSS